MADGFGNGRGGSVESIPIIDLTGWDRGDDAERLRIADVVDAAASSAGFMQVVGHGVPESAIAALATAMDSFFALPMGEKMALQMPPASNRGYSPPRSEQVSASLGVLASAADLFEAFNVGSARSDFPGRNLPVASYPENAWPAVSGFHAAVQRWQSYAGGLARTLTDVFALALGLPDSFFAEHTSHSIDTLRLNNYRLPAPDVELAPDQLGMGAHTDYGIVTVLWADRVRGLQILGPDGSWRDILPAPGALLVNLGDLLARWTNDRWRSTMHRVLPPVDAAGNLIPRRSAAFFHDGNWDARIEVLDTCISANADPLYPPITVGEHIAAKLAGSRGLQPNTSAVREAARLSAGASGR